MNLACPIDNKDDSIQKVSAVVASGQSYGTFSVPTGEAISYDGKSGGVSGYSSLSGSATSSLAQLLAQPSEPNKPVGFGIAWLYLWVVGIVIGTVISFVPITIFLGIVKIIGLDINPGVFTFFGVISQWVGIFIAFGWLIRKDKEKKAKKEVIYLKEKFLWEKAIAKWNQLYYCHKHDIVFDPENGETCAPNSLIKFRYQSKSG